MVGSPNKSTAYVVVTAYTITQSFFDKRISNSTCQIYLGPEQTVILKTPYSFDAKSTDSVDTIFEAYAEFYNSQDIGECSNAGYPSASLPSTPVFTNDGIISRSTTPSKQKTRVAIAVVVIPVLPVLVLVLALSASVLIRRYRKRKLARRTEMIDSGSGAMIGVDLKPEMDAEERMIYELQAREMQTEADRSGERVEIEGSQDTHEMSAEKTERKISVLGTHELRGEEHSKELEALEVRSQHNDSDAQSPDLHRKMRAQ